MRGPICSTGSGGRGLVPSQGLSSNTARQLTGLLVANAGRMLNQLTPSTEIVWTHALSNLSGSSTHPLQGAVQALLVHVDEEPLKMYRLCPYEGHLNVLYASSLLSSWW